MLLKAEIRGLILGRLRFRKLLVLLLVVALPTSCRRASGPQAQEQMNLAWLGQCRDQPATQRNQSLYLNHSIRMERTYQPSTRPVGAI